jgi:hypothetical protein
MPLMLGKLPPKDDTRTIKLVNVLKVGLLPPLPVSFDVDANLQTPMVDNRMYLNDIYGDCVVAGLPSRLAVCSSSGRSGRKSDD